jgi:hypothetical protein
MRQRLTFPLLWSLALLLPWAVYGFATDAFHWNVAPPFTNMAEARTHLLATVLRPTLFAFAQWLVLRGRVRWAAEWALTHSLAGLLSLALASGEFRPGPPLPWSTSLFASLVSYGVALLPALAEWLLLQRHARHAWMWLALAAGWMLAGEWLMLPLRRMVTSAGLSRSVGTGMEYALFGLIAGLALQWVLRNQLREPRHLAIAAAGQRVLMWAGACAIVWQAGLTLGDHGWGFAGAALQTPVLAFVMRRRALWWIPASLAAGPLLSVLGMGGYPLAPIVVLGALQTPALFPGCGPQSLLWLASTACVAVLTVTISPSFLPLAGVSGLTAGYLMHVAEERREWRTEKEPGG